MKIQAVTMAINHPADDSNENWLLFAEWACDRVEENLGLDRPVILSNEVLHLGINSTPFDHITSIKLLLFKLFPKADRIFFFDCDWRPVRKFNLFDYLPKEEGLYFTIDRQMCEELKIQYGMKNPYFNTGFFIADRSYEYLFDIAFKNYTRYKRRFGEQCVMNQVFDGHITYLDPRLNVKDYESYRPSEILGYHSGNNYEIFKRNYEEFNWK